MYLLTQNFHIVLALVESLSTVNGSYMFICNKVLRFYKKTPNACTQ